MSAFCLANCWQLRTSQWLMSKAPVKSQWFFFKNGESTLHLLSVLPPLLLQGCWEVLQKIEQTSKKTTRTTVTAYSLSSSTLAVHDWPLFTLKFGVLSSLLVDGIAAAKYSDRRSPTPRPTQRSAPSTAKPYASAPSTAKPHAQHHAQPSQRAQHAQHHAQPSPARPAGPNPRPTKPSAPTSVSSLFFSKIEPHS